MTAGEFNELAKQGRVWAKIVANFSGEYGLVEKISGLTNQFVRFTVTTLIISKKPGNTGISRDIRTEFTTDLLLSD